MSWADALENVNYLAVVLGMVASMVIGASWYAAAVFGNSWMKLVGLKQKDLENKDGMAAMMAIPTIFYGVASLLLALLFEMTASEGLGEGLFLGAIIGFAFGFGPMAVSYTFARRKFELSMIDGGYIFFTCAVIGAIIGVMN